jgi:GTP-binding protein Era
VEKLMPSTEPRKPARTSFTDPDHHEPRDESSAATSSQPAVESQIPKDSGRKPGDHQTGVDTAPPVLNSVDKAKAGFKAGYVAIIGQPNVGKSTLLNAILNFKISMVSPKPQSTRKRVLGISNRPNSQIIFFDTPGILEPPRHSSNKQSKEGRSFQEVLVRSAYQAMKDADVQLMMVEPTAAPQPTDLGILNRLADTGKPIVLAINKIDTIPKDNLLPLIDAFHTKCNAREIVPISATQQDGVERLVEGLERYLPVHEPFYEADLLTNQPERFLAAEIVREKIFMRYAEEIPYSTSVQIEEFVERPGHKDYIRAVIYVERESQKGILIGKGGWALKQVGKLAREELERLLGRPVYLDLFVAVKERWRERESELRSLGYL